VIASGKSTYTFAADQAASLPFSRATKIAAYGIWFG
jgi:hypothetical protein